MKMKAFLILVFFPLIIHAQQSIHGSFSPKEKFTFAILYRNTPTDNLYSKDMAIDSLGNVNFQMTEKDTTGVYTLVYGIPQEDNNVEIIYNGKEDVAFNLDLEKGISFTASKENIIYKTYKTEMVDVNYQIYQGMVAEKDEKFFTKLLTEQATIQKKYEKMSAGLFCHTFIKAAAPYIPKTFLSVERYNQEIEAHYFDAIDVTNDTLQKSSFLFDKFIMFIRNEKDIDTVVTQLDKTSETYKMSMEQRLWQELSKTESNPNAKYLAKKYLIMLLQKNEKIKEAKVVQRTMNLTIGAKAPDFSWDEIQKGKTVKTSLYDQKGSENYVVVFWSSTCSHCLKQMPELNEHLAKIDKAKLSAIAYGLEEDDVSWKKEIKILPNFTHVLGLGHWDNEVRIEYDVHATPTFFLLNAEKEIIAKPKTLEELLGLLENEK